MTRSIPSTVTAFVLLVLCAGPFAEMASAATIDVEVTSNRFTPRDITINSGDTVRWTNVQGFHNVDSDTPGLFRSGEPANPPWVFEHTFTDPGTFIYHCDVHGAPGNVGMAGTVTVQGAAQTGTVRFSAASATVSEGAGSVTLTVQRVNGTDGDASVNFATNAGSAAAGSDFQTTNGTLNWADGDGAGKSIQVTIVDDAGVENGETFTVTLSNASGATLGGPSTATVTINDNDAPQANPGTLALSAATISLGEEDGEALVLVNRTGGSDGAASVDYSTTAGSATAGEDFSATNGTLNWADGDEESRSFAVPILNDDAEEGQETFTVTLSNATGAALGSPDSTEVQINDDDSSVEPFTCVEDEGTLCLANDRFQVRVTFLTPAGDSGDGQAIELTPDTGYFWFFNEANVEMVLKVLNACSFADRFWVFSGGLTNVEVEVTVVDSETGTVKTYMNPQRVPFQPIQDTDAFATCP